MVNLYRDKRRPCAHGIEPLTNLTRKDVKLQFSTEAFENIKKDISQKIILAFPSYSMHMSYIHYIPLLPIQHFKVSLGLENHSFFHSHWGIFFPWKFCIAVQWYSPYDICRIRDNVPSYENITVNIGKIK
jgi:hypothetical protein